ncbi:MAG: hypothetical protein HYZ37_00260 [Candidatus Solibacter usitatus]|nr:hypothetical protein [Candidatus Solibacter usitatus]
MGKLDLTFKSLAEGDPLALLELFGNIDLKTIRKLTPLEREIAIPIKVTDHAFIVETDDQRSIQHFEAQLNGGKDFFLRTVKQEVGLWLKTELPLRVTVVWLSQRHAPKEFPEWIDVDAESLKIRLRIRHVKVWELEAKDILKSNRPNVWPWVGIANTTKEDVIEAAERIRIEVSSIEEKGRLTGELSLLTGLRYNWFEELNRRTNVFLSDEILQESFPVKRIMAKVRASSLKEGIEKGLEKGLEKGIEKGRGVGEAAEARRALRLVLQRTIPSLAASDLIDKIAEVARLEELLGMALDTRDETTVLSAMERAAS